MLADALAAEAYKFLRQRGGLFWGFCAVPLGMLLVHFIGDTWMGRSVRLTDGIDLGRLILDGLNGGDSAFFHIFFIAGAVAIFSGEYRWETWRLLTPRNSRVNLFLAKVIVYATAAGLSLVALGLEYGLHGVYAGMLNGGLKLPGANFPLLALGIFLVNWAELLLLGLFAALIAVMSRAMIGPLIAGICFSFVQLFSMIPFPPWDGRLQYLAAFPGRAAYQLRYALTGEEIGPGMHVDLAIALPSALFLLAWILLLGAAALVRFQRQDLPRE
jgi:ABC-2 type transport system permease protein